MTLDQALVLGVLQGVTEFLPVSSSGHLALAQWLVDWQGPRLLFNVVVHLGTLAAIALVLRGRLYGLARAALSFLPGGAGASGHVVERRWLLLIALSSIPTAIIGLVLHDGVTAMYLRPPWVGGALLVTAALLVLSERIGGRSRGAEALGVADAVVIGLAQGIGVVPGISRSGATLAAALCRDVRGDVAVEFSILLSVPAVLGAGLLEIQRSGLSTLGAEVSPLLVGFAAAFVVGSLSLQALRWVVVRRRLLPFAVYCALVGAGAIALG